MNYPKMLTGEESQFDQTRIRKNGVSKGRYRLKRPKKTTRTLKLIDCKYCSGTGDMGKILGGCHLCASHGFVWRDENGDLYKETHAEYEGCQRLDLIHKEINND